MMKCVSAKKMNSVAALFYMINHSRHVEPILTQPLGRVHALWYVAVQQSRCGCRAFAVAARGVLQQTFAILSRSAHRSFFDFRTAFPAQPALLGSTALPTSAAR